MLNKIIEFSINNKLVIGIFTIALIIWGVMSLRTLPIDAVPDITNNQVQVITLSPSLATQEIEQFISYPIEQTMSTIPEIQEVRSISRFGLSVVTIIFHDDIDIYWARQQVSERLPEAKSSIPAGLGNPEMAPVSTGLGEIYQYTVHAKPGFEDKYDATKLRTIQDWIIRKQLLGTPGIAEVNSFGGFLKQYEIALNINQLRSYNLSISDVFTALEKNNQNTGGSYIDKKPNAYFIRSQGLITSLGDIERIVVKNSESGLPITIRDVAKVQFGTATRYGALTRNDKEAVGGIVMLLKDNNASEVVGRVKDKIDQIRKTLPDGVEIEPFLDRSEFVDRAMSTVQKNLIEGALIVILVLVLFLGNIRSGLIVASVIPLAMLFAVALMKVFGVSGNLMSLGAIDFGLIVDGAVIIVEATMHHMRKLKTGKISQAEMDIQVSGSAKKMMNSAAFGQLIILIVYLPILALVGIEGKMFRPMAQTVSFAIFGALILSLTYVPMISSLLLSKNISHKKNFSDKMMEKFQRVYDPLINGALRFKKTVLIVAIALLGLSAVIFSSLGGEFLPTLEEGDFAVETRLLVGSSLEQTVEKIEQASSLLMKTYPEVKEVVGKIGASEIPTDPMPIEATDITILLKPKKDWTSADTREELAEKMQKTLEQVPGVTFGFSQPIQLRTNELISGVRQDVGIKIFGDDLETLSDLAKKIGGLIPSIDGAEDLYIEQVSGLPQISIKLNRDNIARYGLNVEEINNAINTAFAGGVAGTVFEGEKRFDLVVRLEQGERQSIEDVKRLFVTASNGNQVPLEQVAEVSYQLAPNQIQREDAKRRIIVGFNVRGRDIASVVKDVQAKIDEKVKMPTGYFITYGGQFKNLEEANKRLSIAVPIALGLILLLLYFAFGSLKYSLLIFTAIPMSAIGGIFALWLRGLPFSISAGVGFIALFGVAVLNGIVLITEFNQLKKQGMKDIKQRILAGTAIRLRPVLMTATVASLGFLPMALATGAGGEVQKPLATVVIGGLFTATFLTLVLLPVLYSYVENIKPSRRKLKKTKIAGSATIIILFLLSGFNNGVKGQITTNPSSSVGTIDLNSAISASLNSNPNTRVAKLGEEYQSALKGSVRDYGKTNINLTFGQYNSLIAYDNNITISQNIPNPVYLKRLTELADANINASKMQAGIYKNQITYQVKSIYYSLLYRKEQRTLNEELIALYEKILRAADIRFQTGETNILEKYNANTRLQEAISQKLQTEEYIKIHLEQLKRYTGNQTIEDIMETTLIEKFLDVSPQSAIFNNNPDLLALKSQIEVAKEEIRVEKSRLLPDFSVGYFNQSLVGNFEKNGVSKFYGVGKRFQGVELGISIPIFAKAQKAKIKAAEINQQIQEAKVDAFSFSLSQRGSTLLSDLKRLQIQINFYRETALPQAKLLITKSQRAFEVGEMDYYQVSQSINNAVEVQKQYIESLNQYNQTAIELELISGL
ncbi:MULTISPECIES: CusA/CzcA family heavy metal efflux RND transporter [Chryseobacterium group]|uniref:CusA/CzcA family heavy metal efflux RND transporter n=1 Tax=Chryseobacterium group TaxID=2782232 RepID=UPI0027351DEA|nr:MULTISPECIES: CusA/CzcA family heavy metal efflux RND transporter [Chryseobacterium group]MDP2454472.1 CusA/CzcA family heavy metal efflux RND transporter [Kaistella sp. SH11-4b]MDP2457210.1 CusA/CzcA family heavy metal efflux RND transporter [Kaistella sp. SH40-3]MDP2459970.1 CusA/CzcA family heavy metal efflux RND transporter [Kaistella sp. SH19-2b]MDQ0477315.1 cobalt-zinc-cadmium resistance protein CzcA [Chryseobacterium sp. MDT2-18]